MWFRADLRVADNPALYQACQADEVVAVYCLTQTQWDQHGVSRVQRSLIVRQIECLRLELEALNIPLIVLDCGTFERAVPAIVGLVEELSVETLFFNAQYELNEERMSREVQFELQSKGCDAHMLHDQCLISPGGVMTGKQTVPKVFSAFKRRYLADFYQLARAMAPKPTSRSTISVVSDVASLEGLSVSTPCDELWPAGENEAFARLEKFGEMRLRFYSRDRDHPARAATSTLSPYLAVGIISTAQCLYFALESEQASIDALGEGAQVWVSELIWRDFYRHVLWSRPDLCRHKPYKKETDALPWSSDAEAFEIWKEGRTGFPLVDAAMRQLKQTGWMHNRLRMVVAMFLTKHLNIDWRLGEAYFMSALVDADFASNNGGWQWSASTGVDAVPYFRIFNPIRQSERFDECGEFIRTFVPELGQIVDKTIHNPRLDQRARFGYPEMMVDHAKATANTKAMFKALSVVAK